MKIKGAGMSIEDKVTHYHNNISRNEILTEVWTALHKDDLIRKLDRNSIRVEVQNDEVRLRGYVAYRHQLHQIEDALTAMPLLPYVHTKLVADSDLAISVAHTLGADPRTHPYIIHVGCFSGWVHLNGEVPTLEERMVVEEVAASDPHVRGIITLPRVSGERSGKVNRALQPPIHSRMHAVDGLVGTVSKVVINPRNRLVSHIVVNTLFEDSGHQVKGELVVPAKVIDLVSEGGVFLTEKRCVFAKRPNFSQIEFPLAPIEWHPPFPYTTGTVHWHKENNND